MMQKTKRVSIGLLAGAVFALPLFLAAPASAAELSALDAQQEADVREWFASEDVLGSVQDELVAKINRGETLESAVPGAVPASSKLEQRDGFDVLVERFDDGSVLVTGVEQAKATTPGRVQTRAISGCSGGSHAGVATYSNCRVYATTQIGTIEFRAGYYRAAQGAAITSANSPGMRTNYGTADLPTLSIVRANANGVTPAVATAHTKFTSVHGGTTEDIYLSLRVLSSRAYTTNY